MMKKYRIVVIGDSFSTPRMYDVNDNTINDIEYCKGVIEIKGDEIYPEYLSDKLENKFNKLRFSIINLSSHANTSYNSFNYKCLGLYMEQPDFLILQIGLVDCWNRKGINWGPFSHMEGKDPWVSIEEYEKNMTGIIKFTFKICKTVKHIFMLNIPLVGNEQYKRHQNSYERTIEYNKVLQDVISDNKNVTLIDNFKYFSKLESNKFESLFCRDNLHYNLKGNKIISELISKKAEAIIGCFEAERLYHENNIEEALEYIQEIDKTQLTEDYQRKVERLERICLKKS